MNMERLGQSEAKKQAENRTEKLKNALRAAVAAALLTTPTPTPAQEGTSYLNEQQTSGTRHKAENKGANEIGKKSIPEQYQVQMKAYYDQLREMQSLFAGDKPAFKSIEKSADPVGKGEASLKRTAAHDAAYAYLQTIHTKTNQITVALKQTRVAKRGEVFPAEVQIDMSHAIVSWTGFQAITDETAKKAAMAKFVRFIIEHAK